MKILRSLLYSPGNRPKLMEKGPNSGADALIFDLEDTVPLDQKAESRRIVPEYIAKFGKDCLIYVRVNALETGMLPDDLDAVVMDGLAGVMVPKTDSVEAVRSVDAMISDAEQARGLPTGKVEIGTSLETARGVHFAY